MAVSNTTTASNQSWLDSFINIAQGVGQGWLQYRNDKTQAELNKLQQQNTFNQNVAQIQAWSAQQKQAQSVIYVALVVGGLALLFVIIKAMKKR